MPVQCRSPRPGVVCLAARLTGNRMVVPLYVEMPDGNIAFLGRATLVGNTSIEQKAALKGMKTKPKRAVINYYDDVLASPN
jgi:hypothetical protein